MAAVFEDNLASHHLLLSPADKAISTAVDENNFPSVSACDASTPLSCVNRNQFRRHRPEGESPDLSETVGLGADPSPPSVFQPEDAPTPAEANTDTKSEQTAPGWAGASPAAMAAAQQQQQQQALLNAYYAEMMWQSYYSMLASIVQQQMMWSLPAGAATLQDWMAQQQQQQQHNQTILKWSNQVAAAFGQNQQDMANLGDQKEAASDGTGAADIKSNKQKGGGGSRPEMRRTRIDMDEFRAELSAMTQIYRSCMTTGDNEIERAANSYRCAATAERHPVSARWEGSLHVSHPLSVTYSRKVFLGGVPWDMTDIEVQGTLRDLGKFELVWPQVRERHQQRHQRDPHGHSHRAQLPRGYCYLVFETESQVKQLLQRCTVREGATYFRIGNSRVTDKEVQVIPWCVSDASFSLRGLHTTNAKTTIFVGALHGMITAANLAAIMKETFGEVVCAALDTDRFKYPIGSGRVVFANPESYKRAVEANFLEVKTPKFVKTIQIDPYLEDSMCSICFYAPGVYFCRAINCFQYYCPQCWQGVHKPGDEDKGYHKPLRRTFRNPIDRKFI